MEQQTTSGAAQDSKATSFTEPADEHVSGQSERSIQSTAAVVSNANGADRKAHDVEEPAAKRLKTDGESRGEGVEAKKPREKVKGTALIKEEYLILAPGQTASAEQGAGGVDDDAAEGRTAPDPQSGKQDARDGRSGGQYGKRVKMGGQNKDREFGSSNDFLKLCNSIAYAPEFSPKPCRFGERCNLCHDLRKYLSEGRRPDLETFGGECPVWKAIGRCPSGWKCRFVRSHSKEVEREDGRKELVLFENEDPKSKDQEMEDDARPGVVNVVSTESKFLLNRKKMNLEKSEAYCKWLDKDLDMVRRRFDKSKGGKSGGQGNEKGDGRDEVDNSKLAEYRAQFIDPPFKPSEKRKIYFGRETPVLAPLTTQGNLPFRRICVEFGAQGTYSEMAMSMPLIQGQKGEWALMKAHEAELTPPKFDGKSPVVRGYDNSRDFKFGAQIAGHAAWMTTKATEALVTLVPRLRLIDLNCGCPIDLVFKAGAGSALLDQNAKLERMVRGMNAVSGEVPITVKLRTGVKDNRPTVQKTIERLVFGGSEMRDRLGAPGTAAITLHGRSRQQRYTKAADWAYIAETAALIKSYNEARDALTDTVREPDPSTMANTSDGGTGGTRDNSGRVYFLGNGDCYSHVDYLNQVDGAGVDAVMIGRGALIKPWIFEEIERGQYIDKSASERLGIIERFARYGLDTWGSDEIGLGYTRRFLLEYLSFAYRYVPVGILDYLPPSLNDRPPAFRGRSDLETLLASGNYKDWIKLSEMFLGPAHPGFKFQPKHKSNSYEIEAEG